MNPSFGQRDPDARGYYGAYGGRFVPETLVAPVEELERAYLAARADEAFTRELGHLLRNYVGRADAALRGAASERVARRARASSSNAKISRTPARTRSTTRSGRRCSPSAWGSAGSSPRPARDSTASRRATVCALLGLVVRRLHGRRRHGAAVAECLPDAAARRDGPPRRRRQPHAEGRDQRSDARLGHQRRRQLLPARLRARAASLSADGARVPVGHRPGGARAVSRYASAACPTPSWRASAAAATPWASSTRSSPIPTCG